MKCLIVLSLLLKGATGLYKPEDGAGAGFSIILYMLHIKESFFQNMKKLLKNFY
jgi:hypothetical protein